MSISKLIAEDKQSAKEHLHAELTRRALDELDTYGYVSETFALLDAEDFEDEEFVAEDAEFVSEDADILKKIPGMTDHVIKAFTHAHYGSSVRIGKDTKITTDKANTHDAYKDAINKNLDKGHGVVITVSNKLGSNVHGAIIPSGAHLEKPYRMHDHYEQISGEDVKFGKKVKTNHFSRDDVHKRFSLIDNLKDKDNFFKTHDVHVHGVSSSKSSTLTEDAGNLKKIPGMTDHLVKAFAARGSTSNVNAGQNSEITSTKSDNRSKHRLAVKEILDKGRGVVVTVNGKIHKAAAPSTYSSARVEYKLHNADGQHKSTEMVHPKPYRSGGRMYYTAPFPRENTDFTKGDTLEHLTPSDDKDFYKNNKVEVHSISKDSKRLRKARHRLDARKGTGADTNIDAMRMAGAKRLADKHLGDAAGAALDKAKELHAELGKHIEAGDTRAVRQTASALADHVQKMGMSSTADEKERYARLATDLHSRSFSDWSKKSMKRMRDKAKGMDEEYLGAVAEIAKLEAILESAFGE